VFFEWSGPAEAMHLSAIINRHPHTTNTDDREALVIHSYDITN
jgi:hypothetical protein